MSRLAAIAASDEQTWRRTAACRGKDPRTFFETALLATARRICGACMVRTDCLDEAIADEREGFWGGTTDAERARIAEQRRRAAARPKRRPPRPAGQHYELLERLTEHPDRWARLDTYPSAHSAAAVASLLRNGQKASPPGRWEFEARVNAANGSDLYARYLGAYP